MNVSKKSSGCLKLKMLWLFIFSSLLFSSCELLLNEAADCIVKVKPNLPAKNLVNGTLNVEYYDTIVASAINHVNDDDISYSFEMIGRPPKGINYYFDHRNIYFSGIPTEKGVYTFSIKLRIGSGTILEDDGICFSKNSTSKKYAITIN